MSEFGDWLQADDIELNVRLPSKHLALEALARRLGARSGGSSQAVFDALSEREALGSTGLGHGVALPHARLDGLKAPLAACLRLQRAIDFDAPDGKPVSLVLAVLLPRDQPQRQLQLLAQIAERLSDAGFRDNCAQAHDAGTVAALFVHGHPA